MYRIWYKSGREYEKYQKKWGKIKISTEEE